ncbi:MAG: hypothetical protein EBX02_02815, partial [Betaproteobacteria bacterium]|nr:hypothetical protein [Betaproteobacteria bacterium]
MQPPFVVIEGFSVPRHGFVMKRTEADMRSEADAMPVSPDGGQYPYGLNICLDKDELEKLGI